MNKSRTYFFIVLFSFTSIAARAYDQHKVDSLETALSRSKEDVDKINIYRMLSSEYRTKDTAKALDFAYQSLKLSEKNVFAKGMGNAYIRIGAIRKYQNRLDEAMSQFQKALENFEKLKYSKGILQAYLEIAALFRQQGKYNDAYLFYTKTEELAKRTSDQKSLMEAIGGYADISRYKDDYVKSLSYYLEAIKMAEAQKDILAEGRLTTNMAIIYHYQKNYVEEMKLGKKSLALYEEAKDSANMILALNNLGEMYYDSKQKEEASKMFDRAQEIVHLLGEERTGYKIVSSSYSILGKVAFGDGDFRKALENYRKALSFDLLGQEKKGASSSYGEIGTVLIGMKRWDEAEKNFLMKKQIAEEIGYRRGVMEAYERLSQLMSEKGDFKKAYEYQSEYLTIKETLLNEKSTEQLAEMQTKFESAKKEKEIQQQSNEIQKQNNEAKQRTLLLYTFIGSSIVFLLLAFFATRQFNQKKKANLLLALQNDDIKVKSEQIVSQKEIIEEKNKDITDSINYAKRIQEGILPPEDLVHQYLKESFVLYKPKDIVSGDIFWVHRSNETVMFAAIDCTGHGVPGALMSVLGHSAISTVMTQHNTLRPASILNHINNSIAETFKHHYARSRINDGMDMSLCALNRIEMTLNFAGAKSPLCLIRNNKLIEVKGDKQTIAGGSSEICEPFTNHEIPVQKGDCIYIFSDGYGDQFGGHKGKKFKYSQLKELLVKISAEPMHSQKNILDKTIEDWKGTLQQVDDILMIGVRV